MTAGSAPNCAEKIRQAWPALFSMAENEPGRLQLAKIFHLCRPLQNETGIHHLALWLLNAFSVLAMRNYPYPSSYLSNGEAQLPAWPMQSACSFLADQRPDSIALISSLFEAVSVLYNATKKMDCVDLPRDMTSIDGIWGFHYCTEMLLQETYFSSNGISDMFWNRTISAKFVQQHCQRVWGTKPDPEWIRIMYGDADTLLSAASNIVFTNGMLDPWRCCGVKKSQVRNNRIKVLKIENAAHHLDLFFHHVDDPNPLLTHDTFK
uniref:Lysosomal ProX carboxypeptidase putative n=1 Tax=Albugo laibachii Nc14 TaxID=890382 RepID=F0WIF3_9STRA|nr:lysosomal ProX carboxypeptidase putative [Albugo laibachii Nc14]|eukprot:CCA21035.1 lysosomal ProX carboxypeptidase putative [Albugo laibachii Nc14]